MPSLLVDELLRLSGASNIATLVSSTWSGDTHAFPASDPERPTRTSLRLHAIAKPMHAQTVYCSPRIGLDLSHKSIPTTADENTLAQHPRASRQTVTFYKIGTTMYQHLLLSHSVVPTISQAHQVYLTKIKQ